MLLDEIILHCHNKLQKERSIYAVYHLLTGKQSIQTIQDAELFALEPYFSIYKTLHKEDFDYKIASLLYDGYLTQYKQDYFYITSKAEPVLQRFQSRPFWWNGRKYGKFSPEIFERLLLFIQVWTNKRMNNQRYIPIITKESVLHWMREDYRLRRTDAHDLLYQLYKELILLLDKVPRTYVRLFLDTITTTQQIGLTTEQISKKLCVSAYTINLKITHFTHYLIDETLSNTNKYPLLYSLFKELFMDANISSLTHSAEKTYALIEQGRSLSEIANIRNLKLNTIYDHVVEISISVENFSIDLFVSKEKQQFIIDVVEDLNTFKLKDIKKVVGDNISYFEIRLTLSKMNNKHKGGRK